MHAKAKLLLNLIFICFNFFSSSISLHFFENRYFANCILQKKQLQCHFMHYSNNHWYVCPYTVRYVGVLSVISVEVGSLFSTVYAGVIVDMFVGVVGLIC